jgi:hypothetical protein
VKLSTSVFWSRSAVTATIPAARASITAGERDTVTWSVDSQTRKAGMIR